MLRCGAAYVALAHRASGCRWSRRSSPIGRRVRVDRRVSVRALATRERRLIKRAFQHYVAPAIVEQMLDDPSTLKLGGEEYEVTVLFSDLEGSRRCRERLTPAAAAARTSASYFKAMIDVLLPQHGTLDKLIGDAIMVYFGCPIPDAAHAVQACRGALAMQRA